MPGNFLLVQKEIAAGAREEHMAFAVHSFCSNICRTPAPTIVLQLHPVFKKRKRKLTLDLKEKHIFGAAYEHAVEI